MHIIGRPTVRMRLRQSRTLVRRSATTLQTLPRCRPNQAIAVNADFLVSQAFGAKDRTSPHLALKTALEFLMFGLRPVPSCSPAYGFNRFI
jgi:hypothetical protein